MSSNYTLLKFAILDSIMIIWTCARIPMHLILLSSTKQICSHAAIHIKDLTAIAYLPVSLWKAAQVSSAFLSQNNNPCASFESEVLSVWGGENHQVFHFSSGWNIHGEEQTKYATETQW